MTEMKLVNALKHVDNKTLTTNGATALKSTFDMVYDMFAFGGAYRGRSEEDCILLFKNAYDQDPEYALKCLFYLRDITSGMGERRFFRVCLRWLADYDTDAVIRNMKFIPLLGRYDDLYCLVDTPVEKQMFDFLKQECQLALQELVEIESAIRRA